MECDFFLRIMRDSAARAAGGSRRHRGRDGDRGCPHSTQTAPARIYNGLLAPGAGGRSRDRESVRAHRPANPLGPRHGADIPPRQSAHRTGADSAAAALLFKCDAAFLLGPPATGVPHGAAGLLVFSVPHYRRGGDHDRALCLTAYGAVQPCQLAYSGTFPALLLE